MKRYADGVRVGALAVRWRGGVVRADRREHVVLLSLKNRDGWRFEVQVWRIAGWIEAWRAV